MTRKQIEELNGKIITDEQYDEIKLHEEVESLVCLGCSGIKSSFDWYVVQFTDGTSIDVYLYIGAEC